MSGFPRKKSVRTRLQHVWDGFVNWGVTNREKRRVLASTAGFGNAFERVDRAGSAPSSKCRTPIRDAIERHILRADLPIELISKTMAALAEATMDLIVLKQPWQTSTQQWI